MCDNVLLVCPILVALIWPFCPTQLGHRLKKKTPMPVLLPSSGVGSDEPRRKSNVGRASRTDGSIVPYGVACADGGVLVQLEGCEETIGDLAAAGQDPAQSKVGFNPFSQREDGCYSMQRSKRWVTKPGAVGTTSRTNRRKSPCMTLGGRNPSWKRERKLAILGFMDCGNIVLPHWAIGSAAASPRVRVAGRPGSV